jgi:hypothetical protein
MANKKITNPERQRRPSGLSPGSLPGIFYFLFSDRVSSQKILIGNAPENQGHTFARRPLLQRQRQAPTAERYSQIS